MFRRAAKLADKAFYGDSIFFWMPKSQSRHKKFPPRKSKVAICYIACSVDEFNSQQILDRESDLSRKSKFLGFSDCSVLKVAYGGRHWCADKDTLRVMKLVLLDRKCSNRGADYYFYIEDLQLFKKHAEEDSISCLEELGFLRDLSELDSEYFREASIIC